MCVLVAEIYRVAHLVEDNLLLTSNWELRFSKINLYCDRTLNLMSTNSAPRPDGPPCIDNKNIFFSFFNMIF